MELRVLHYFLAVAREQSISAAAQSLHLTQPTLSTQLKALEEELGKQLLVRGTKGSRKVTLTEEGMILRKRAEEILTLVNKAEEEIAHSDDTVVGTVSIGAGETDIVRYFAKAARTLQKRYPDIRYQISSGNAEYVLEYLDKGLIDFGLVFGEVDHPCPPRTPGASSCGGIPPWRRRRPSPPRTCGTSPCCSLTSGAAAGRCSAG